MLTWGFVVVEVKGRGGRPKTGVGACPASIFKNRFETQVPLIWVYRVYLFVYALFRGLKGGRPEGLPVDPTSTFQCLLSRCVD